MSTNTHAYKHTRAHLHGMYPHTDENDDTADVLKELDGLESEYYTLGMHLHLPPGKVKVIQKDNPHSSKEALGQVTTEWLKMNYEYNKVGRPSWRMLVESVSTVDIEHAKMIASNHKKVHIYIASFNVHRISSYLCVIHPLVINLN